MSTQPVFPEYLCVKDVAGILKSNAKFVYLHQQEIPGYLKVAGKILFDSDVLFKELKKRSGSCRTFPNSPVG